MPVPTAIFTIGYEGLLQPQVVDLLSASKVDLLLDVRAIASSRKAGFSKTLLSESLKDAGIGYRHDRRLGTPKPGRQAARSGRTAEMTAVFAAHMETLDALAGLADAVTDSRRSTVCLLCFERAPHECHRAIVATLIRARTGQSIRHL